MMMNRVQKRSLTILVVLIVVVLVGIYAVLVSGALAFIFDPDVEASTSAVAVLDALALGA